MCDKNEKDRLRIVCLREAVGVARELIEQVHMSNKIPWETQGQLDGG